jgi:hypothetical protein
MQSATGTCWHAKVNEWLVGCSCGIICLNVILEITDTRHWCWPKKLLASSLLSGAGRPPHEKLLLLLLLSSRRRRMHMTADPMNKMMEVAVSELSIFIWIRVTSVKSFPPLLHNHHPSSATRYSIHQWTYRLSLIDYRRQPKYYSSLPLYMH